MAAPAAPITTRTNATSQDGSCHNGHPATAPAQRGVPDRVALPIICLQDRLRPAPPYQL